MPSRLIEVFLSQDCEEVARKAIAQTDGVEQWSIRLGEDKTLIRIVAEAEDTEPIIDAVEHALEHRSEYRIAVLAVEASLPRPTEKEEKAKDDALPNGEEQPEEKGLSRISRAELYDALHETVIVSRIFISMVVLAAIVATIGMARDNVAIIIGAMVLAPLLGPNMALALGTTLADWSLAKRAIICNSLGVVLSLFVAALLGLVLEWDPSNVEIASRTAPELSDVLLALAAGAAGAIAFTSGVPSSIIGVMVAVALLPPTAAVGMLSIQYPMKALGALHLLGINVVCVNLSAVGVFYAQGLRPRRWWKAENAKRMSRVAFFIWLGLLAALIVLILFARREDMVPEVLSE